MSLLCSPSSGPRLVQHALLTAHFCPLPPPPPCPPQVDVDLSAEAAPGDTRISRQQAQLWLDADGGWRVRCTGRRPMRVNGAALGQGATCALPTLSHLAVGGVSLLFVGNVAAAARAVARAAQPAA